MEGRPSVSICITTYNVAPFIRECIESALAQVRNFSVEIIVCDDASTDETPEILREYEANYGDLFRVSYNEVNLKYARNYMKALSMCRGEYIAVLDGDDYWTDNLKLQKQIDFLVKNPHYSGSYHNALVKSESGDLSKFNTTERPEMQDLGFIIDNVQIWNSSFVYRNIYESRFPRWLETVIHPDQSLHLLHALRGPIKYFSDPMGVYRKHANNISKIWVNDRSVEFSRSAIVCCVQLKKDLPTKYHPILKLGAARHLDLIAGHYWKKHSYLKFLLNVFRGYLICPVRSIREYKDSYYHLFRQP